MPAAAARQPGRTEAGAEWDVLLVVAAGGALGSLARWALTIWLPTSDGAVPVSTWVANTTGALAIGVLLVCVSDLWRPNRYAHPFLGVGVLGGYTTWSTYVLDVQTLVLTGQPARGAAYLFGTLVGGLAAAWTGAALARLVVRRRRGRQHPASDPRGSA